MPTFLPPSFSPNIEALDQVLGLKAPQTKEELKSTQKKELQLWHHWNDNGRKPEHLKPLLNSYRPLLERTASKFVNKVEMPTSSIHSEYKKYFVHAMKTYDPKRGVQLNTWLGHNLKRANRFVMKYQNIGKIPEAQIGRINKYKAAKDELSDKLGYEPDAHAIADHLRWSVRTVNQLQKELRADIPASQWGTHDPTEMVAPKEAEALRVIQYGLAPEHRLVYEHTFGVNGKKQLQPGEIAKKLGMHPSKVSRIRKHLQDKFKEALEVV